MAEEVEEVDGVEDALFVGGSVGEDAEEGAGYDGRRQPSRYHSLANWNTINTSLTLPGHVVH